MRSGGLWVGAWWGVASASSPGHDGTDGRLSYVLYQPDMNMWNTGADIAPTGARWRVAPVAGGGGADAGDGRQPLE